MTPYAVLLCRTSDADTTIRHAFHAISRLQHPDVNGGVAGPQWATALEAYNAIKTEERRAALAVRMHNLSGLCTACDGAGVQGSRAVGGKIKICSSCYGEGRCR